MVEKAEENTDKMVDSKNITLKIKSIRILFCLNTILLILVSISPYIIPYIYPEIYHIELLVVSAIMMTVTVIFYLIILTYLSSVAKGIAPFTEPLAEKMMSCKLRIKNGLDYCAKCPDGYACASGRKSDKYKSQS